MVRAWISHTADQTNAQLEELDDAPFQTGEVKIQVQYSCLNYKDALALTHKAPIARKFPMVHGIDGVGLVVESSDPRWQKGQCVQVNDWGLGETHWGGLSTALGVPGAWVTPVPEGRSGRWAAALGTAGYTAALSVMALIDHGTRPEDGPVLVTGVTGGVGSVSTLLLKHLGYEVLGLTGSIDAAGYPLNDSVARHFLNLDLDASQLIHRDAFAKPGKPLQKTDFAAVVDSVGSHTLVNACARTNYGGIVTACGLAQGMDFEASVAPFILRGITLRGINCVLRSEVDRARAWGMLAQVFDEHSIDWMFREIPMEQALEVSRQLLNNEIQGRVVVRCA